MHGRDRISGGCVWGRGDSDSLVLFFFFQGGILFAEFGERPALFPLVLFVFYRADAVPAPVEIKR